MPWQYDTWQDPPEHVPEQTLPQDPQLALLALVLTSQPSVNLLLLQSAKPALQVPLQTPAPHDLVRLAPEQTWPQPPQLLTSLPLVWTSQPLVCLLLSQSL